MQVESGDTLHPRLRDDEDLDGRGHPREACAHRARGRVGEEERVDLKRGLGEQPFHDKASLDHDEPASPQLGSIADESERVEPRIRRRLDMGQRHPRILFRVRDLDMLFGAAPRAAWADDRVLM